MSLPYRLYYAPDNASLIVRLALEELGADYETVLVDRAVREQRSPGYLRLNPAGLIPTLMTADGPVSETGAVLLWLADRHGALAPPVNHADRGAFLKWLFFISNTLHADMRVLFYADRYVGADATLQSALRDGIRGRLGSHFALIEEVAAANHDWLAAEEPSALDLYIVCLMRWVVLYPEGCSNVWFRLENYPHLHHLAERLESRASAKAAQQAEGLGPAPFTAPTHADPPEGTAT